MSVSPTILILVITSLIPACSDDGVSSDEEARRAYFGMDESIANSSRSALQASTPRPAPTSRRSRPRAPRAGTITITGQVDQGNSNNKGMRLHVGMAGYTDGQVVIDGKALDVNITYATNADSALQPALTLSLKNIPTGTLTGTLVGDDS